jgi:hypothetical protein
MDLTSVTMGAAAAAAGIAGVSADQMPRETVLQVDSGSTIAACRVHRSNAPSFAESSAQLQGASPSASYVLDDWMNVPSCQA